MHTWRTLLTPLQYEGINASFYISNKQYFIGCAEMCQILVLKTKKNPHTSSLPMVYFSNMDAVHELGGKPGSLMALV